MGLFIFYISLDGLFSEKKLTKNSVHFVVFIIIYFYILIYLTITKSYGLLIYPCIFTWLATFYTIFIMYKKQKNNSINLSKDTTIKPKKHKIQKTTNKESQPTKTNKEKDIIKLSKDRKRYLKKNNDNSK
ncbi:hypothetical protein CSF_0980 [Campylobacter sputorum bv. faecalis CCUG 20703]|nr:hypothetical protein CSF_0980 [Campylobacter sputorum bv. faecalis CCUG 20703]